MISGTQGQDIQIEATPKKGKWWLLIIAIVVAALVSFAFPTLSQSQSKVFPHATDSGLEKQS